MNAVKENEFVGLVAEELEVPLDKAAGLSVPCSITLRNRFSHEESFQLLAQLPVWLTAAYVAGWRFDKNFYRISHLNDFLDEVTQDDGANDFGRNSKAGVAVASVFNALKYFVSEEEMNNTFNIGLVMVTAQHLDKWAEIGVIDSGIGMEANTRGNLFTKNNSASVSGTSNEKGSGLGLILVNHFVAQHGGTLCVKIEIEKGICIFFTIQEY